MERSANLPRAFQHQQTTRVRRRWRRKETEVVCVIFQFFCNSIRDALERTEIGRGHFQGSVEADSDGTSRSPMKGKPCSPAPTPLKPNKMFGTPIRQSGGSGVLPFPICTVNKSWDGLRGPRNLCPDWRKSFSDSHFHRWCGSARPRLPVLKIGGPSAPKPASVRQVCSC